MDTVYPEEEWQRLFSATCDVLGVTPDEAEQSFSDYFCSRALADWPMWFKMSRSARDMLTLQPLIHNGFATGTISEDQRKEINDKFRLEERNGELVLYYRSPNRHCGLYKANVRWLLRYYGEEAALYEAQCMKNGDPECEIHIRWNGNAP